MYKYNIERLKEKPYLRGTTPWLLMYFRSPRRPLADIHYDYNHKGVISKRGKKKKAFYLMKDYFQEIEEKYENK
ncbi:MAG: hypothetical protein ACLFT3_20065 [Cyclobacteriaceae bacterium]